MKWLALLLVLLLIPAVSALQITEIMYNCEGSDEDCEWIEVYNNEDSAIDLVEWRFYEGETNHKIKGDGTLEPGEYAVIADNSESLDYDCLILDSTFSLKNKGGEDIAMRNPAEEIVDFVSYTNDLGADGDGNSLQLEDNEWCVGTPTPGGQTECSDEDDEPEEDEDEEDEEIVEEDEEEPEQNETQEIVKDTISVKEKSGEEVTGAVIYQSKAQRNDNLPLFLMLGASVLINVVFIFYFFKR